MKNISNNQAFHLNGCVIALGTFDGVHIAHQVLLEKTAALAARAKVPSLVYTFCGHPLELIAPDCVPPLLTTATEKEQLMEQMNMDLLCAVAFDEAMMKLPPEVFVGEMVRRFHPKHVVCGYNYSFGVKGSGSPEMLMMLGSALGFGCTIVPKIQLDGMDVSSTLIRQALSEGRDELARKLLGRPYSFSAIKVEAQTFAMLHSKQLPPCAGTHRVMLTIGEKTLPALLSVRENGLMTVKTVETLPTEIRFSLLKKLNG